MRSEWDLARVYRVRHQVGSSRCPACRAENTLRLAESFMLVRGIHSCQVPVLTLANRILSALMGLLVILEQVCLWLSALSFPLISFLYPVGCSSLRDRHPIKMKLLGVLAFEEHVAVNVLFLLKCSLSSCLSLCQVLKDQGRSSCY